MDNIRPTGTGDLTDYKFPGDNGGTASGTDAILFDAIPAEGNANNFMDYDYLGRQRMKMAKPKCLLITSMLRKQEMILL